ncbi:MAG: hypothetical protein AB1505_36570 [Candidatus Latescibacterota bacterium]
MAMRTRIRSGAAWWRLAFIAILVAAAQAQAQDPAVVRVTIAETSARPGDRLLVPVVVSGLAGRQIVSGGSPCASIHWC